MTKAKDKKIFTTLLKAIFYIAISFVCLLTIFLLYYVINAQIHANDEAYRPKISIYTIVSPSMTPVINVYDVVVNIRVDNPKEIEVGDIITYKSQSSNSEGMTITHRVIAIDQLPDGTYEYLTQGDNNSEPDSLYVTFDNVIGREIAIVPSLGRLQFLIANHKWWLILIIIPLGIYLAKEIFRLVELFNLKNRVDNITAPEKPVEEKIIPNKIIPTKKIDIKETTEKNKLEETQIIEPSTYIKSDKEPIGFLEKYTETIVSVETNKYAKRNKNNKKVNKENLEKTTEIETLELEPIPEEPKTIKSTKIEEKVVEEKKLEPKEEKIKEPIPKPEEKPLDIEKELKEKVTNDQYEILDTDELSSKIKEYDSKINQLDKMIKDMEIIKETKIEEPKEEREVENFLQGTRLKVINVELTNNNEEVKKTRKQKRDAEKINLSAESNLVNPNMTVNRPDSEDIKDLRGSINNNLKMESTTPKPKNNKPSRRERLNLNPRSVKKVNRSGRQSKQTRRQKLNLNPSNVKKINRPNRNKNKQDLNSNQKPAPRIEQPSNDNQKLISIEKIK